MARPHRYHCGECGKDRGEGNDHADCILALEERVYEMEGEIDDLKKTIAARESDLEELDLMYQDAIDRIP